MVVASNSGENGWRQREPSQGGARRSPPKGFDLRRTRCKPKADVDSAAPSGRPAKRRKKQRHSRGEMRSEHNRGASLGAFLLALSTITLLFVSPVEGQNPPGAGQVCDVTAFPSETGSCPPLDPNDMEPLFCDGDTCEPCFVVGAGVSGCDQLSSGPDGPDTVANCQRSCFDFYACTSDADCPYSDLPFCTEGQCGQCEVSAFPGAAGSCPDIPVGGFLAGPQLCVRTATEAATPNCIECAGLYQFEGITTAADCELLETNFNENADVVANCQRGCFGFYACTTNADCPDTLPFCNLPQGATEGECSSNCVVSAFPGEPGSCPATDDQGDPLLCSSGQCQTCGSNAILGLFECETVFSGDADQIANCLRSCFDYYACTSNADCPADEPTCFIATGDTDGYCISECEVNALPGAAGSCPDIPEGYILSGPQLCARTNQEAPNTICESCAGITSAADCETVLAAPPFNQEADVVANCQRSCFDYYACATKADCPDTLPFCNLPQGATEGECSSNCVISSYPGEPGSCDDTSICLRSVSQSGVNRCDPCLPLEIDFDFTTAADCETVLADPPFNQEADVVANCQRSCFGYYACATNADCQDVPSPLAQACTSGVCADIDECVSNADCPADRPLCESGQCLAECGTNADCPSDRPICNAGQCEISIFSPLDGMGGGSSA